MHSPRQGNRTSPDCQGRAPPSEPPTLLPAAPGVSLDVWVALVSSAPMRLAHIAAPVLTSVSAPAWGGWFLSQHCHVACAQPTQLGQHSLTRPPMGSPWLITPILHPQLLTTKCRTPVPAGSAVAASYVSPFAFQPQGSPYSMEDNNPHKCFISGFTGFVPRARFLIGAGYPLTTHRALVEFGQARGRRPEGGKGSPVLPPLKSYPTDMGLLPHYAGYVPGYKFQFGHTYGQLTHNALGLSTLEKQLAD
uniref:Ciliary microtubule inner protein 2B n=1 Tax=Gopherus evgoodei TaxID=1825980 RepID=A0A8C4WPP0_9SAUR